MSFTAFPRLPPELRDWIWRLSFPSDSSGVYFYGELREESRSVEDQFDGGCRTPMVQGPVLAALFVTREARCAALEWYRSHGFRTDEGVSRNVGWGNGQARLRPWDGIQDAIYVSFDHWQSFLALCWSADKIVQRMGRSITHLILPVRLACSMPFVIELMHLMPNLRTVSVIWGALPLVSRYDWRPCPFADWPPGGPAILEVARDARLDLAIEPRWEMTKLEVCQEARGEGFRNDKEEEGDGDMCLLNQRTWTLSWVKADLRATMEEMKRQWAIGRRRVNMELLDVCEPCKLDFVPVKAALLSRWE